MKRIIIKLLSGIQIGIGLLFTFLALYNFRFEQTPILSLAILFILMGLGIFLFKRTAYMAELIMLIPICCFLFLRTGIRIIGLFSGIWKECPPAYFLGFITEQIILISSLTIAVFLLKNHRWYWEQSKINKIITNQSSDCDAARTSR